MKTELKINTKEQAKRIYAKPELIKELLEKSFGKEAFREPDYTDYNSFDDVCKANGTTEKKFEEDLAKLPVIVCDQDKSFMRLRLISEAMNKGWEQNTLDTSQYKWAPIFVVSSRGLDFSGSRYNCDSADAAVGSCLCYKSNLVSNYVGQHPVFGKMWKNFIAGKNL